MTPADIHKWADLRESGGFANDADALRALADVVAAAHAMPALSFRLAGALARVEMLPA